MMCPKCHCVDSHAAYCEDRETKDAPINLPELPLALTHLSVVKKRWCREWANAAVLADRAGREEPMTMECTKKEAHEFIEELSLSDCPCFGKEFNGDWYAISFDSIVSLIGMARRPKNWVAAPSPAEPLLPRECRHCFVRCADCPEPAEPPAAPVHQEPVAFMGRAPGWGWDFEPCDSGPDPTWTECYPLYTHPSADLRAERDRLRALLWDCRDLLDQIDRQPHMDDASTLIARIDAELKNSKGD